MKVMLQGTEKGYCLHHLLISHVTDINTQINIETLLQTNNRRHLMLFGFSTFFTAQSTATLVKSLNCLTTLGPHQIQ